MRKVLAKKEVRFFIIMSSLILLSTGLFLFYGLSGGIHGYAFPRRLVKLCAFTVTGIGIGFSTVIFQTITNNNILTPSIIGLDNLYLFIQTVVIFFFGSTSLTLSDSIPYFLLTVGLMMLFSVLLFKVAFSGRIKSINTTIMVGIICGGLFNSLATFMQVLIDPNEFLLIEDKMFASFNNVNTSLVGISAGIILVALLIGYKNCAELDVLALGRELAINLGISYDKRVFFYMLLISLLVAVATALVGPITFLGLLTANISRQLLNTYKHKWLLTGSILLAVFSLIIGQFIVERILSFSTTISVIINFIGGIYFIYLLLKTNRVK